MNNETETLTNESQTVSDTLIFSAKKLVNQQRLIGAIMLVTGFIMLETLGTDTIFIGFGALYLLLSFVINHDEYITLGPDYIALKLPFRSKVNVLFSEITSLVQTDKKIVLCYHMHSDHIAKQKRLLIWLTMMLGEEKTAFINAFNQRTAWLERK